MAYDSIIKIALFDPLIQYITSINSEQYIEFTLPSTFIIDRVEVEKYFYDAELKFSNREPCYILGGTLRDEALFEYLRVSMNKRTQQTVNL